MLPLWLYGKTGYSFIDVWTAVHFAFWFFIGSNLWAKFKPKGWQYWRVASLGGCLAVSYIWEVMESILAPTHQNLWHDWFEYHGKMMYESPWNSWISDPLTSVVALLLVWHMLDNKPQ